MNIDEQASIQSILEALKGNGISEVAKQIDGISKDPLGKALNAAGYRYSSAKPRGWHFTGEEDEPLEKSIFDYVKRSVSERKVVSQRSHNNSTTNSQQVHTQFTEDEVLMIKNMLKSWGEVAPSIVAEQPLSLHERIKQLPTEDKVRKTIVIDDTIGNLFDEFCDREKLNKSDLLHLAMADLMDTYK